MAVYSVKPFKAEHGPFLDPNTDVGSLDWFVSKWSKMDWNRLESKSMSFTMFKNNEIALCSGVVPIWHGRCEAWVLRGVQIDRHDMLFLHKYILLFLNCLQGADQDKKYRRVELTVKSDFRAGHKWAKMLGFTHEGHMPHYDPLGNAHDLYGRVYNVPIGNPASSFRGLDRRRSNIFISARQGKCPASP